MKTTIYATRRHFNELARHFLALGPVDRRGLKTLFVRNLNLNLARQRLALRLGMSVACAPNGRTASLEVPAMGERGTRVDGLAGKITLADDSLHAQWNGAAGEPSLLDLPEPVFN